MPFVETKYIVCTEIFNVEPFCSTYYKNNICTGIFQVCIKYRYLIKIFITAA